MKVKDFMITLFWKQNKYHNHSVIGHTLKVFKYCLLRKQYRFIVPSLLHDVGKPFSAHQKPEDVINNEYSFTDHEEISYQIVKWFPISEWSKQMIRWHYLIRKMSKSHGVEKEKLRKIYNEFSEEFKNDLKSFLVLDDLGK